MSQLGWLLIATVTIAYLNAPRPGKEKTLGMGPSSEREVDPTRWRHDGSQPLFYTKGNGASFVDETVAEVQPLLTFP